MIRNFQSEWMKFVVVGLEYDTATARLVQVEEQDDLEMLVWDEPFHPVAFVQVPAEVYDIAMRRIDHPKIAEDTPTVVIRGIIAERGGDLDGTKYIK